MVHCWENSPKAYSKRSVLGLACESTSWLTPSLSVCPGSACCLYCPLILGRLLFEPQKPCDNRTPITELSVKLAKLTTQVWVWIWLDHVGGIRCCESNESRWSAGWLTCTLKQMGVARERRSDLLTMDGGRFDGRTEWGIANFIIVTVQDWNFVVWFL